MEGLSPTYSSPDDKVEDAIKGMKIENRDSEEEVFDTIIVGDVKQESTTMSRGSSPTKSGLKPASRSPKKSKLNSQSPDPLKEEHEETVGGDITVKTEPGKPLKLARSSTQKVMARPPPLFDHLPDKTDEATGIFQVITQCTYSNKYLGSTEHAMECDCSEEWGKYLFQYPICLSYPFIGTKTLG